MNRPTPTHLSDDALIAAVKRHAQGTRESTVALIVHLAELRQAHRRLAQPGRWREISPASGSAIRRGREPAPGRRRARAIPPPRFSARCGCAMRGAAGSSRRTAADAASGGSSSSITTGNRMRSAARRPRKTWNCGSQPIRMGDLLRTRQSRVRVRPATSGPGASSRRRWLRGSSGGAGAHINEDRVVTPANPSQRGGGVDRERHRRDHAGPLELRPDPIPPGPW